MEQYQLFSDRHLFCIRAASFPDGVLAAHQQLHALVPYTNERDYFGISYPLESGEILYKAGMSERFQGELSSFDLEGFEMKKGNYLYIDIGDFMKNISTIGEAFTKLISDNRIDPQGACIEWYMDNDVCRCMVRLKDEAL